MSKPPGDRIFSKSHEWIKCNDESVTVGVTEHAQESLGDVVFVELPESGKVLSAGDAVAAIESVNAALDMLAPDRW